jgi:hypothetical protein
MRRGAPLGRRVGRQLSRPGQQTHAADSNRLERALRSSGVAPRPLAEPLVGRRAAGDHRRRLDVRPGVEERP